MERFFRPPAALLGKENSCLAQPPSARSYNGTVHLTTSDAAATLSPDGPVTNGVGFFTMTPGTLGTQTVRPWTWATLP